jgi:nucleoside-diphosphate-sugar epimerase
MECARQFGVSKFVGVGTICEYPTYTPVPFVGSDLWNGYPEEPNAPYGLAKTMLPLLAIDRYDGGEPVNLAAGREISIRGLARLAAAEVGYSGTMVWDTSKPNGQLRRCVDASLAKRLFGFEARTRLRDGILRIIAWHQAHRSLR